jgi:hypothetical protein
MMLQRPLWLLPLLVLVASPAAARRPTVTSDKRWYNTSPSAAYQQRKTVWTEKIAGRLKWMPVELGETGHARFGEKAAPKTAFEKRFSVAHIGSSARDRGPDMTRYLVRNNKTNEIIGEIGGTGYGGSVKVFRGQVKERRWGSNDTDALTQILAGQRGYQRAVRQRQDRRGARVRLVERPGEVGGTRQIGYVRKTKDKGWVLHHVSRSNYGEFEGEVEAIRSTHGVPTSRGLPKISFWGGFHFEPGGKARIHQIKVKPGERILLSGAIPYSGSQSMADLAGDYKWDGLGFVGGASHHNRPMQVIDVPNRKGTWDLVVKRGTRYQAIRLVSDAGEPRSDQNVGEKLAKMGIGFEQIVDLILRNPRR